MGSKRRHTESHSPWALPAPLPLVLRTSLPSALNLGKEQTERKDGKRNQSRSELGEQQSREKKNTKTFKKVQLRSDDRLVEGN